MFVRKQYFVLTSVYTVYNPLGSAVAFQISTSTYLHVTNNKPQNTVNS